MESFARLCESCGCWVQEDDEPTSADDVGQDATSQQA